MLHRRANPRWDEVRANLRATDVKTVWKAAVGVGKIETENIPDDIAESTISLFHHPDREVRAEAVRAIGIHWRLERSFGAVAELLDERMLSYRQLLYVERRLEPKEYRQPDPSVVEQLARFDVDRPWVESLVLEDTARAMPDS